MGQIEEKLKELMKLTNEVLDAQQVFFKSRRQSDLIISKKLESGLRKWLKANQVFEKIQPELFSSDSNNANNT